MDGFFRLHRRRQLGQHGYQPISYQEMADYGERIARLSPVMLSMFYRAVEETDNAVLYDYYQKSSADLDAAKEESKQKPGPRRTPRRKG